ncbi:hypothetical protein acdb102_39120 [Acidothermaceae bacterium B102]|nr:hypothetical protein acdb102_39120 [Acidothermaceae bacterium B102]
MSERIEDELRALLQGRAATVADVGDPVTSVQTGVRRAVARRRLSVVVGVPVAAAAVVVGASILPHDAPQHQVHGGSGAPSAGAAASATASTSLSLVAPAATLSAVVTPPAAPATSPLSPSPTTSVTAQTPQVGVFRTYLEDNPAAHQVGVSFAGYGGRVYCGLQVLDQSAHQADLAAFCQEFYLKGTVLTEGSGSFVPARLTFTGAGAATRVNAIAVPRDGHPLLADLKKLFSPLAYGRWLRFYDGELGGPGVDESAAELKARAVADVQSGRLHAGINKSGS